MREPMLALPDAQALRFALYAGSHHLDLTNKPECPVATFEIREHAVRLGSHLWPSTYKIVDLEESRS